MATARWTTTWPASTLDNLVKMDILVNGDIVDALSVIVHRDRGWMAASGRSLLIRLKKEI